jgi:hypothetical protein
MIDFLFHQAIAQPLKCKLKEIKRCKVIRDIHNTL